MKIKSKKFHEYIHKLESKRNVKPFLLVATGSKLYGFEDEESDIDIRGIVIDKLKNKLTLGDDLSTLDGEAGEVDYQLHELEKFMGLMYKGNFNIIEQVFSPLKLDVYQYAKPEELKKLKELAKRCVHYRTGNHVRGWADSIYKMDWSKPKKCLYAVRPMMVYINFLKRKEFVSDITKIVDNEEFKHMKSHINKIIELKRSNGEVPLKLIKRNEEFYDNLKEKSRKVEDKYMKTKDRDKLKQDLNEFLLDMRREYNYTLDFSIDLKKE